MAEYSSVILSEKKQKKTGDLFLETSKGTYHKHMKISIQIQNIYIYIYIYIYFIYIYIYISHLALAIPLLTLGR